MRGAFLYLAGVSIRNRISSQVRRLRNGRYVVALVLGVAYFWFFLFRESLTDGKQAPPLFWGSVETVAAIGVLVLLLGAWLFGSEPAALAFSAAEVHFLFPAPVTRRELIGYKLFRAQIVIVVNALIWVFLLRRGGSVLPAPLRFVGAWVLFSNLSLHRLGAALVRTSLAQHGRSGARRQLPAIVLGTALLIALVAVIAAAVPALRAARGAAALARAFQEATSTVPALVLLYVPRVIVAPTFAQTAPMWLRAMGPAIVLALAQAWWVVRSDTAFEEAAVEVSAARARRLEARRRRRVQARPSTKGGAKWSLPLSPAGPPAGAIVWKNTLLLMRTARIAPVLGIAAMAFMVALPTIEERGMDRQFVAMVCLTMVLLLQVLGTRVLNNDLRQDVEHLESLKVLPLRGRSVVTAEVLSSALPVAVLQMLLVVIAYLLLLDDRGFLVDAATRTEALFLAPAVLLALNLTTVTIQNGAALLFPGWVRIGPNVGGIEGMGQGILSVLVLLVTFLIALIPAALGFIAVFWAFWPPATLAWIPALIVAMAVLFAEAWLVIRALGRSFEKLEPGASV